MASLPTLPNTYLANTKIVAAQFNANELALLNAVTDGNTRITAAEYYFGDNDSGWYEATDDDVRLSIAGTDAIQATSTSIALTGTTSVTFNDNTTSVQAGLVSRTTTTPANDNSYYFSYQHGNNAGPQENIEIVRETITMKAVADGNEQGEWKIGVANASDGLIDDIIRANQSGIQAATGYIDFDNSGTFYQLKIINIGDWDMDAGGVTVNHGLTFSKIRGILGMIIRNDANDTLYFPDQDNLVLTGAGTTSFNISRKFGGTFDSTDFDSTSYNRGWIPVLVEE